MFQTVPPIGLHGMMEWYLPSNSGPLRNDGVILHTEVSWWVDGTCGESRDCTTLKGVCVVRS